MLRIALCIFTLAILLPNVIAHAQQENSILAKDELQITMSANGQISLQGLIQWLAQEKSLTITTDSVTFPANSQNAIRFFGKKALTFSSDDSVAIVQSILRANGLALVQSSVKNVYQIVQLADVRPFVPVTDEFGQPGTYATGVFPIEHVSASEAKAYIEQFLYTANDKAKNITTVPNADLLVITETGDRLLKVKQILESIDKPKAAVFRSFYELKNIQAIELKQQLDEIFSSAETEDPTRQIPSINSKEIQISAITSTNQLLISGLKADVASVIEVARKIDVPNTLVLKTYQFSDVSAKRIDELVKQEFRGMEPAQIERVYQGNVNEQANELVANTQPQIHTRIEALKKQLDMPAPDGDERSPVRFYTLKNVKAIDIVDTLQSIERRVSESSDVRANGNPTRERGLVTVGGFIDDRGVRNSGSAFGGQGLPGLGFGGQGTSEFGNDVSGASARPGGGFGSSVVGDIARLASDSDRATSVIPGEARITVDEHTNTLIIVAEPATQKLYQTLIERLDVRRPQVLIEVTIVTLSKNDDYNLGIEISGGDREGSRRLLGFTNFDSGRAVGEDGILTINPSLGFNGALIDPQTADVILKALATHQTARVTSAPKILVNDNATGLLSSTEEVPFQATTSNSVATSTSVGGFLQAGTTINVTPQISEDDYLNLEFDILVNDFSGTTTAEGLPPGRSINQVTSSVSIPDGHTIVVGGLSRQLRADDLSGLPFIERIPILNRLTSNEVTSEDVSNLFVFIKPVILRDDKFRDLRFLSEEERRDASLADDLPYSSPVLIR